ncbi:Inositol 2-dehydrogenase/D-chiro-inositol 3-dehydrogenase [Maioricimonas rarisocia]|uniref:Inositol 2-dehydrogenase/D-chiro-inositol 3-dehydrogenase n=1 Tax=Maioricimonas rarisocia TaxID=2528026 RepID=A0A517ZD23_9PLAN|nr:Gfo/Idh/MocA family oxidoreductase [Maioricimonas rarisocia]QDU40367.1 Inositol 2-dehydrogenase/D-chiro-inositol 3-dehydrogenase [Maioricimonas rarisocia]
MHEQSSSNLSRRTLLQNTGRTAAAAALAQVAAPGVFAGEDNTIRVALVGCGGRGTGAAANALATQQGPVKLVAMADVFTDKLDRSHTNLKRQFEPQVDVPEDRKFIGFDGYQKAMDALRPGDVVILATPPAFRWVHFTYAIEKGLNVFMEKPVTVDGPTSRKMLELGEESVNRNLKVGVGLMCRHCVARKELYERIRNGEIGEIQMLRAYRMAGPTATAFVPPRPEGDNELMYQIRNFHGFLWASGGAYSDFLIHNIDESCWMKDAWPVEAKASGGRHYRGDFVDQNFDTYSVEYTFADGTKLYLEGRTMPGCYKEFASYAHGTKGSAIISTSSHAPAKCRIFSGQNMSSENMTWAYPQPEPSPYQLEWDNLMAAIRNDTPHNEVKRGVEASLVTSMGRLAAHTGQLVTYDQMLNHDHEFAPEVDQLVIDGPAPVQANAKGHYPVPLPGIVKRREY